jgi:hypothetical protein
LIESPNRASHGAGRINFILRADRDRRLGRAEESATRQSGKKGVSLGYTTPELSHPSIPI